MNETHNLGPVEQIPQGEGRAFRVGGRSVTVFRLRSGAVYATQSECPHRGGPLSDGLTGGSTLICPLHGWRFDLGTGLPVLGRCGLTTHAVRIDECGDLHLTLSEVEDVFEQEDAPCSQAEACRAF